MHRNVVQKLGIVIEDEDYIIRKRYWVVDRSVVGQVVRVERVGERLFLTVQFPEMTAGWQERGINIQNRRVTTTQRTVQVRPESWSDGATIDVDEVTFTHEIQGEEVDSARCGLIILREGKALRVRYPSHLLASEPLRKGDTVMRSWDWHDGFADGGDTRVGSRREDPSACVGIVEAERDRNGFVSVKWIKTGRRKSHRFDHQGFYDIEKVP